MGRKRIIDLSDKKTREMVSQIFWDTQTIKETAKKIGIADKTLYNELKRTNVKFKLI